MTCRPDVFQPLPLSRFVARREPRARTYISGQQGGLEAVELALKWVDWFNHRRLLEPIGNVPPAEKESAYHQNLESAMAA